MNERYRVEPTGRGFWPFRVVAGDGERELFIGHRKSCERVAAELTTAFRDGEFVGRRDSDALHAEAEALRAENGRKQQTIDGMNAEHWKLVQAHAAQAKELEAARGLLRELIGMINCTVDNDSDRMPVWISTKHPVIERIDAFLTATQAPEVRQDEDAWQTLHALSKAPQEGEKMTAERLHAICEAGHDRKAFVARLAEQGERQEAVVYAVHAKGMQVDHHCPLVPPEMAADYLDGCATPLYTTPQPGPDVRALVAALGEAASELEDWRMSFPDANATVTNGLLVRIDSLIAATARRSKEAAMTPEVEAMILKILERPVASSGRTNAQLAWSIGRQPGSNTPSRHAAFVRGILLDMEKRGLIKRAGDDKPIIWQIVRDKE